MPNPRVLCRGWRGWTGAIYPCHSPLMQPGEPGGRLIHNAQCKLCLDLEAAAQAEKVQREAKRTEKRAATGKLTAVLPEDPFEGMRGTK